MYLLHCIYTGIQDYNIYIYIMYIYIDISDLSKKCNLAPFSQHAIPGL